MDKAYSELTYKQKLFVDAYAGNVQDAAKAAGLSYDYCRQLITKSHIVAVIKNRDLVKPVPRSVLTRIQRQELMTEMATNPELPVMARLKALELLAKSEGDFIERRDVTVRGSAGLIADLMVHVQLHEKAAINVEAEEVTG